MKTARFVLSCHSVGTSLPEIVLSAWMSASSFAGSPRCAFALTRNVTAPAVVLFQSSSITSSKMSALLLTSLLRLHLPIFLQLSAALGCRTNTTWVLSQECRIHVTAYLGGQLPGSRCLFNGWSWLATVWVCPWSKNLCVCVCCFVSLNRYWGIVMYGPGASS